MNNPGRPKPAVPAPTPLPGAFPIICIGGSARGVRPYVEVVQEIPADASMAIVVVNHSRKTPSRLPAILGRITSMPVHLVHSGMKVQPAHVYVIPPNQDLTLRDGNFHLAPLSKPQDGPKVFTVFLESVARQWRGKPIAIVLSGLEPDGVKALETIKAAGGLTFAQKIATAKHPGMPRNAVNTGCVDYELQPAEIGREIARIAQSEQPAPPSGLESAELQEPARRRVFPIVGIGASAGGLEAFTLLLENLPADTGMAFVLVQHLDPMRESHLSEILSRKSKMPVIEVHGFADVQPNHVYIIPPGKNLTIAGGVLQTVHRAEPGHRNMPIDEFLEALAADRQNGAFGVILSGTASDGTVGARAIKTEGGITIAQEPASAKFDSMPRSAIASGAIDFILPPQDIGHQLAELARHSYLNSPLEKGPDAVDADARHLSVIFARVRTSTGIDFTHYKHNTLLRRIKRRMALRSLENLRGYAQLMTENPAEVQSLAQDFLINVTSFFREPEVHTVMRDKVFPGWLDGRSPENPVRVWVPGCSTGEEAYSVAIGLVEFFEDHGVAPHIQIFATDLSETAIQTARAGVYPERLVADIPPERRDRFFVRRGRTYQVSQTIRDLCVFARQDLTRDPPFSRVDLVSCCNLLIYLGPVLQKKVLSLFHYALKPNGILVLGSSESPGPLADAFDAVDSRFRIFRKRGNSEITGNLGPSPSSSATGFYSLGTLNELTSPAYSIQREAERMLLAQYAPPSVLIDESMRVIHVRGQADLYLQVPQGAPSHSLTTMLRPGLLTGVKAAVAAAAKENLAVCEKGLRVKENDVLRIINVRVFPIRAPQGRERHFLVIFEEEPETPPVRGKAPKTRAADGQQAGRSGAVKTLQQEIAHLDQELTGTRDYLQSIIEAQEAYADELRSANEEIQANNEELDTAREELQASNEELNTVNDELRVRNIEQGRLNTDLRQLLESINVPLVMVGRDLRIRWFTPAMEPVLNLLPNDQGRPLTDLRATLIPNFVEMLIRALAGSEEKSVEFQRPDGTWLSLRILPYRGPEHTIEGAIATLIDINELKRALDFAEAVVDTVREPLIVLDDQLRVRTANEAFHRIYGLDREVTRDASFTSIARGQWNNPRLITLLNEVLPRQTAIKDFEIEYRNEHSEPKTMLINAREIRQNEGDRHILLAIDDVTELRRSSEELRRTNEDLKQFIFAASHDLKEPLRTIVAHAQLLSTRYNANPDPNAAVSMNYVVDGALRMESLISGLREFWQLSERPDQGRVSVDCNEVVRQALLNLEASRMENNATITVGPLPVVLATEASLVQLFQNLIANALKYRSAEPPIIHISASQEPGWVFSVQDNGIGIDPKYSSLVFGVFKRLHPPGTYSGTGMGLAICQKIVERLGGRIWVESQPGQGANFRFSIPS